MTGPREPAADRINWLRTAAPEYASALAPSDIEAMCARADAVGEQLGLVSDAAYRSWFLFAILSDGESLSNPAVLDAIGEAADPDEAVREIHGSL